MIGQAYSTRRDSGSSPGELATTSASPGRTRNTSACLVVLMLAGCQPAETAVLSVPVASPGGAGSQKLSGVAENPGGGDLTPGQRRGREIYLHGSIPGGRPIHAVLGRSREPIDAALLACGNCHGHDGQGRPEGGVVPPDVTWQSLRKPYGVTDRFGRRRPAYTEALLGRVVTMGLDSSGRQIEVVMPRYLLTPEELADLVAYLTVLGGDLDPGLSSSTITLGTFLPPKRSDPGWRQALVATLNAYANEVNRNGGLYNRRLELVFDDLDPARKGAGDAVAAFLDRRSVFALVAADIRGVDEEVVRVVETKGVPLIGPFTLRPGFSSPPLRNVFNLHSGLEDQARALATAAARSAYPRPSAIIHASDPASTRAAAAVADTWARVAPGDCERINLSERSERTDLDRLVSRLSSRRTAVVAFLGPQSLIGLLLAAANRESWRPELYLPAALAPRELFDSPPSFGGTIVLALPYLPDDMTQAGQEEYERLRATSGLPPQHRAAQMAVLAAAKVLEEGIRRCGVRLSRVKLVEELEQLDAFQTGFSRPLTFGPNRRIGSTGAYILTADLAGHQLKPNGGWVEVGRSP
jgi:ABC-type branched-subunit amino acid transport system substrate-binding protein